MILDKPYLNVKTEQELRPNSFLPFLSLQHSIHLWSLPYTLNKHEICTETRHFYEVGVGTRTELPPTRFIHGL